MAALSIVLSVLAGILWMFSGLITLWHVYIGIYGCGRLKPRKKIEEKLYHFAVVICARNEESVIGNLIDSLHAQEYPKDKFRVFVVADNCTDDTAAVAAAHGATVMVRENKTEIGKGFALKWALDEILKDPAYDAVTVFDADNVVDPKYLYYTNEALCTGADGTQGYRETKNPFDTAISGCYAIYWYMLSRFYHQGRSNKGMSCSVGGTGFSFKTKMIEKTGWNTKTMTEDSEFASTKILEGYYFQFVRDAVFYDEQPTTWKVSLKQRRRWMYGTVQESRMLLGPAVKAWLHGQKGAFDIVMFMLGIPAIAMVLLSSLFSFCASLVHMTYSPDSWIIILIGTLISVIGGTYLSMFFVAIFSVFSEKGHIGRYWKAVLFYPIYLLPLTVFVVMGFFTKEVTWDQVGHIDSRTIDDAVKEDLGHKE
ncbi:MAG: glycosyltransferase family 2 protein [Clostridia bacterium]|nr:glycosyltransferase family 2 protein [Clostridia bacterium]